jgi:glycosyltransferase involved in cell wall biosynthesis
MVWGSARRLWIGDGQDEIWHSSFYTYLPGWKGKEVVTVHDMAPERFAELFTDPMDAVGREQKRRCIERADAIICDSQATRDDIECIYPVKNIPVSVIPLAHSATFRVLPAGQLDRQEQPMRPFFLYVGSRLHYKNFSGLLEIYAAWDKRKQIDLKVVGPAWTKAEKRTQAALGIEQQVSLQTNINDNELCGLYNTAVALVFPSLVEGFGLPLLEALACGCPVVASHISSTVEVAGDCPVYFELDDRDSLLTALDQVISEGRNTPRTQAGLERAASFSWERTAQATLDVYRKVSQENE